MQKSRHTAFFAFKVQGEKAVRYALFSLHQSGHAKNGKEGQRCEKELCFEEGIPVFSALSLKGNTGSTLAGAMPERQSGAGEVARCQNTSNRRRMRNLAMRPHS